MHDPTTGGNSTLRASFPIQGDITCFFLENRQFRDVNANLNHPIAMLLSGQVRYSLLRSVAQKRR